MTKRETYLSWDDYFMAIALLSAERSKDPNTQVGACIVNQDNIIVSTGYNGFPRGCSDEEFPWDRNTENFLKSKYTFVVHAELNAIINNNQKNLKGCRMYVTLHPCHECAKPIAQSKIGEVIYLDGKYYNTESCEAARIIFKESQVKLRQFTTVRKSITLNFGEGLC